MQYIIAMSILWAMLICESNMKYSNLLYLYLLFEENE